MRRALSSNRQAAYRHDIWMRGQPTAREPQVDMDDNADRVSEMADQAALLIVFLVQ